MAAEPEHDVALAVNLQNLPAGRTWAEFEPRGLSSKLANACASRRPADPDAPPCAGDGMGWSNPTDCQVDLLETTLGLPAAGAGVLLHALNGAGKSGAFLIAAISHALKRGGGAKGHPQVLIVEATSTMVEQVGYDASILALGAGLTCITLDSSNKAAALTKDVAVGTPAQIQALCANAHRQGNVAVLVVDECDSTIDATVEKCFDALVAKQAAKPLVLLVTATLLSMKPKAGAETAVGKIAKKMLAVGPSGPLPAGHQVHPLGAGTGGFYVAPRDPELYSVGLLVAKFGLPDARATKMTWLAYLLLRRGLGSRTIVFVQDNAKVKETADELKAKIAQLHGAPCPLVFGEAARKKDAKKKEENARLTQALNVLRKNTTQVLVVTDSFTRGIDVQGLDLVVLSDLNVKGTVPDVAS